MLLDGNSLEVSVKQGPLMTADWRSGRPLVRPLVAGVGVALNCCGGVPLGSPAGEPLEQESNFDGGHAERSPGRSPALPRGSPSEKEGRGVRKSACRYPALSVGSLDYMRPVPCEVYSDGLHWASGATAVCSDFCTVPLLGHAEI